ncbi:MAG: bifunctional UDP-N-acetylmuramoyl-tripeptide:D-alanyl-D-alanine ligase/alanine racemase [Prevotellaceae bacterium]|jgi:alanine racemase|nr:bifunctional UDP-N-acetylmuramoyl-tripeptide:D-alanyl-D-alanine ligase/alanine racemase [Prevotellaceae bacterium]
MQTKFTLKEAADCMKAQLMSGGTGHTAVRSLLTDSRTLADAEGCLFVALTSDRNDGHRYIEELYRRGVRHFVVHAVPEAMRDAADADFLVVADTLEALQALAAAWRERFTIPVVGITGSNGKTVVKEWLSGLLTADRQVVKSPQSYNSQIGVPLSVWLLQAGDELAVFEAGISQPGEMARLERIIRPTIGILTNIGTAHDAYFSSRRQKVDEKLRLFAGAQTLIYCADQHDVADAVAGSAQLAHLRKRTWGHASECDLQLLSTTVHEGETLLEARYRGETIHIRIPMTDPASVENAMHCWLFLLLEKVPPTAIAERMRRLPVIEMRMEWKEAINGCRVINDSYSSDFHALQMAVEFLCRQPGARKTVILSDILQSGRDERSLYADVARLLRSKGIDRLVGIGAGISRHAEVFTGIGTFFFPDTDAFLQRFPLSHFRDESILLKGARVFAFERIDRALQQRSHETVLEVNLNALIDNLNYYRSLRRPGVGLMAMVKAFSYGSGSYEIAGALQFNGVDYLAVAYADEGVELRKAGITMPVMVMNPEVQSLELLAAYNLEPELYSFRLLREWRKQLATPTGHPAPAVHIKLDTGMHRLGFEEREMPQLLQALQELREAVPAFRVASVFSHLSGSDNPALDAWTRSQIAAFRRMSRQVQEVSAAPVLAHILNSAGIRRFPDAQFDMVRLGIGLYGVGADDEEQAFLRPVGTLKTVICQIRHIPAGDAVGYDRGYVAAQPMRTGVIAIGYADGLPRRFGNGRGRVLVGGRMAPVVGNICMDMCMIDLSDIDAREGDEVVIFGACPTITDVARTLDTIPYEVLTGISRRVKRVYVVER